MLGAILLIAFLVMNCFLPLYAIFPINLYMWLVVGLIWARPLAEAVVVPTAELSAGAPVPNPAHAQS